jgi:type IV pilus assembly protein PilQ
MYKKIIATSIFFCWVTAFVCAQEIVIEKASVISSGNKTTLAINYSGSGRIQFFAVHDEGSLTIDFPGVVTNYDFTALNFAQITKVEQTPLDPDSSRGVSVKFSLADGTGYQFFDGEKGSVILLFDSQKQGELKPVAGSDSMQVRNEEPPKLVEESLSLASSRQEVFQGRGSNACLQAVNMLLQDSGVQISASVNGLESYKYFYLTEPDRYVVDLYGIVCNLDKDQMDFDNPYLQKIRVKQFQVHPEPITRMVLELNGPQEVRIIDSEDGSISLVAGQVAEIRAQQELIAETVSDSAEVDTEKTLASMDAKHSENLEPIHSVTIETDPVTSTVEEVQQGLSQTVPVSQDPALDMPTNSQQQSSPGMAVASMDSETTIAQQVDSSDAPVQDIVSTPKPTTAETVPSEEKNTHQLPFFIVDDVDQELESFIDQEKTIYTEMKDAKPTRAKAKHLLVTNKAIEKSLNALSESNAMQSESSVKSEFENSSLFEESLNTTPDDRIAGGEQRYQGFEIQGIDVVDVQVTDLLRFFADQVGFNLFVDNSVKNISATYKFSNIPWDQAMDIILRNAGLDYQYSNGVLRVATTKKFKQEAEARRALLMEQELGVPPETVTFHLSYAKVSEVAGIVSAYLSPRGSLLQDERTNMLIIEDIPKKILAIRSLIKKLDTQIPQVTIESRIVETTKRFMRELGIQWGLSGVYSPEYGTQTGMTFPNRVTVGGPHLGTATNGVQGGYAVSFPVIDENPAGIGFSLGNILDTFKLDISLQMLESDGLGQIISAPKITTQNNKTAHIQNGQKIPIQTVRRGTVTVRYVNAVLELEVTPHITSEKTIIMDLVVDKSEADFSQTVQGNPVVNVRKAETRVLVKDGGTAVIGGIYVLNEQSSGRGVPGLRKVPFVRRLFGSERKAITNQELLIFVTPRIIKY